MASTATLPDVRTPVAAWWHTVIVLLILGGVSAASAHSQGLPRLQVAGLSARVCGYITTLVVEWLLVLVIWLGIRGRGFRIRDLVSGRWTKASAFLKDLGLAIGFLIVALPCLQLVGYLLRVKYSPAAILPTSKAELALWLLLAATAGFCEELTFRGYLTRQFSGWSGSRIIGVALQGVAFGLGHGYQGWKMMMVIMVFGWMFGALAAWRKSLLPGMLAHGIQDSSGGLVYFLFRKV